MTIFGMAVLGALTLIAAKSEAKPWSYFYTPHQIPGYYHANSILVSDPLIYRAHSNTNFQYNFQNPYYYTNFYVPHQRISLTTTYEKKYANQFDGDYQENQSEIESIGVKTEDV